MENPVDSLEAFLREYFSSLKPLNPIFWQNLTIVAFEINKSLHMSFKDMYGRLFSWAIKYSSMSSSFSEKSVVSI